jgi:toxin ParE1/3/4
VAATFVESVERKLVLLAEFPEMAQTSDEPNVRMTPVGRYPFLIFYTIERDEVVILHVRHAARQRPWQESR